MNHRVIKKITRLPLFLVLLSLGSCNTEIIPANDLARENQKIGVLIVNHGSRSEVWRNALLDLERSIKDSMLGNEFIEESKTAFMEYTEPSIATRLKEFDAEGFTDVILIPVFLSVSTHSFDDIPTIIGRKEDPTSLETLKLENIERYSPKARVHITPLLDFTEIIEQNILRRVRDLSVNPAGEGLTLIAYGDNTYLHEWKSLLHQVGEFVAKNTGIERHSHGWCGHLAHYSPDSTSAAINRVLNHKETAIVIPVLVAHDEMFQIKIIGDGIAKIPNSDKRIVYKPDAILPDRNVEKWVLDIANEYVDVARNKQFSLTNR
ncbi:MAG TPA: cobalamin biosynthesis protein CbiX [Flavobacteriales bacterium]|nr:cobalamin biosynthesis protein CbiX [Flavobacteriales bacterium]